MGVDLSSVAGIVALTLTLVQVIKGYVPIPTKVLAIFVGMVLTAIAYFGLHTIQGDVIGVAVQVIVAILGAPSLVEIIKGK